MDAAICASVLRLAASVDGSASMSVDGSAEEAEAQPTGLGKSGGCSVWGGERKVGGGRGGNARPKGDVDISEISDFPRLCGVISVI